MLKTSLILSIIFITVSLVQLSGCCDNSKKITIADKNLTQDSIKRILIGKTWESWQSIFIDNGEVRSLCLTFDASDSVLIDSSYGVRRKYFYCILEDSIGISYDGNQLISNRILFISKDFFILEGILTHKGQFVFFPKSVKGHFFLQS